MIPLHFLEFDLKTFFKLDSKDALSRKNYNISKPRAYLDGVKGVKAVFQVSKEGFGFIVALK